MSFLWRIKKFWATIFSHLIQHSWYTFYILCKINANDELEMHFFDDMSGKLLFVRRLSVCKLLTFSSSFPQPTRRFRIKLSKTSFGELRVKNCVLKWCRVERGDYNEKRNTFFCCLSHMPFGLIRTAKMYTASNNCQKC